MLRNIFNKMTIVFKVLLLTYLCTQVFGRSFYCSHKNAIASFKRPTYDFSVRFLDNVATETSYHFSLSPLSTWIQLMSLAEGAGGSTQQEIWNVTRYHRNKCFRRKFREILNSLDEELSFMTKRTNIIVIDKLLDMKESFKDEVNKTNTTRIFSIYFNNPAQAAEKVNEVIDADYNELETSFDVQDFNMTVLVMTDSAYFRSDWLKPFDPVFTSTESFYSEEKVSIGQVRLMRQVDYFNLTELPSINSRVLELPFNTNGRVSMLIFLPTKGTVFDLFYNLKEIRLATIFNYFKMGGAQLVSVKLPRFKVTTELKNIPELVYDMGAKRMFYPEQANFKGISDHPLYASLMTQTAEVEVTEEGVRASSVPGQLLREPGSSASFEADRPFAYLIVDKLTDTILFGGMYRHPSIYSK